MKREFDVIVEQDAGGYFVASVPELRGCQTQARMLGQLRERVREAIELCLADERQPAQQIEFVGVWQIGLQSGR